MTKRDKLNRIVKATGLLKQAASLFREVAADPSDHWYLCPDASDYLGRVNEMIESDHGEAGLYPLIANIEQELHYEGK